MGEFGGVVMDVTGTGSFLGGAGGVCKVCRGLVSCREDDGSDVEDADCATIEEDFGCS